MALSTLVDRLESLDPACLDAAQVSAGLRDLARLKGFVAETEHALARRANDLATNGGAPASDVLGRSGHCSPREAQRTARRAETLGALPSVSHQLGQGRISTEHADALANAVQRVDDRDRSSLLALDDEFARHAASTTPGQFRRYVDRVVDQLDADRGVERAERQRRSATLSKGINNETGMYWLRGEFAPEDGNRLFNVIDAETRALAKRSSAEHPSPGPVDRGRLATEALVELATSASRSRRPGRVELLALVDLDTITNGLHDAAVCEFGDGTEVPVATLRRLACDAHIIPAVLSGDGAVLDVGRSQRLATEDQRRALRAMYRTCGIGACDALFDHCEIHHLDEWGADHGATDLDRLIPACSRHHHLIHEGGWRLHLEPVTRELTITLPDGSELERSRPHSVAAPTAGRAA